MLSTDHSQPPPPSNTSSLAFSTPNPPPYVPCSKLFPSAILLRHPCSVARLRVARCLNCYNSGRQFWSTSWGRIFRVLMCPGSWGRSFSATLLAIWGHRGPGRSYDNAYHRLRVGCPLSQGCLGPPDLACLLTTEWSGSRIIRKVGELCRSENRRRSCECFRSSLKTFRSREWQLRTCFSNLGFRAYFFWYRL